MSFMSPIRCTSDGIKSIYVQIIYFFFYLPKITRFHNDVSFLNYVKKNDNKRYRAYSELGTPSVVRNYHHYRQSLKLEIKKKDNSLKRRFDTVFIL